MTKVICDMAISVDGFTAGPNQRLDEPFGDGAHEPLTRWMIEEREAHKEVIEGMVAAGAHGMGPNLSSPGRGEWDLDWKGWWGADPPYHAPVFVLTHHPREPVPMEGGTTFYFVTDGIESALAKARASAGDLRVAIAGGPETVNQYLAIGAIDELRLHVTPFVLGKGERMFEGLGRVDFQPINVRATDLVTHLTYRVVR